MLLSASLLLFATLQRGVHPSVKLMSSNPTVISTPAPPADKRSLEPPHTLDTPRTFPQISDRKAWEARRAQIRQQVLVSCGLYPLPPKTPLKPKIFGRMGRDGYTIEKVYFQTHPGFYLAGNLYRPHHAGSRKDASLLPGILIAHGHWEDGRMADGPDGSIAARAITFARMGCVAFTYDMVGYNDTRQIPDHRSFGADREHWLWGVSLMGLQTWNSVRALDFLESLPDVDKSRLAMTGESGGGTQTMMLGAIDDRLAATAPCVMVSHSMQGGCLCENAPGLRIDFSNMELAACVAPKPQIMVGATGDWTRTMMTIEGPAVQTVYNLEGKPANLKYVIFPFNHNINKTSRDAVYQFFGKVLLHDPNADHFTEPPYQREPVADLRVFPDDQPLPADAKTDAQLTQYIKNLSETQLAKAKPHDKRSLTQFKKTYQPAWERTLALESPVTEPMVTGSHEITPANQSGGRPAGESWTHLTLGRKERGDNIPCLFFPGAASKANHIVVLAHPLGSKALFTDAQTPVPLIRALAKNASVLVIDTPLTGASENADTVQARREALNSFGKFFTTYNRVDVQERVQDIVTVCAYLRQQFPKSKLAVMGMAQAGAWAMLAAPAADGVIADCNQLDLTNDNALLSDELFVPCLRHMGDFRTSLTLAAPHPVLLYNTGAKFTVADWLRDVYAGVDANTKLKLAPERLNEDAILDWLTTH